MTLFSLTHALNLRQLFRQLIVNQQSILAKQAITRIKEKQNRQNNNKTQLYPLERSDPM